MNSEVDNHILVVDSPVTNILPSLLSASSCGSWSLSLWPGLCPQPRLVGLWVFVRLSLLASVGFFVTTVGRCSHYTPCPSLCLLFCFLNHLKPTTL